MSTSTPRKLLAVETSTLISSIALCEDGRALGELTTRVRLNHSDSLLADIRGLMTRLDWQAQDLDGIAVSLGPGSFTGVRIGVATCRAMAWTLGLPLAGFTSLEVLAANGAGRAGHIATILDARKKEVYFAVYRFEGARPLVVREPDVQPPDEAIRRIAEHRGESTWMLGDAVWAYPDYFKNGCFPGARVAEDPAHRGRAGALGWLGHQRLLAARYEGGFRDVEPIYVRPSEAEIAERRRREKS